MLGFQFLKLHVVVNGGGEFTLVFDSLKTYNNQYFNKDPQFST